MIETADSPSFGCNTAEFRYRANNVLRGVSPLSPKNTKPHEVLFCAASCFGVFVAKEALRDGNRLLLHCPSLQISRNAAILGINLLVIDGRLPRERTNGKS